MQKKYGQVNRVLAVLVAIMMVMCVPIPVMADSGSGLNTFDISEGAITITQQIIEFGNGETKTIADGEPICITGTSDINGILVNGVVANIILQGVDIQLGAGACAFEVTGNADVTLILEGNNILKSGAYRAGIEVVVGNKITIRGDGTLSAEGSNGGAAIGGYGGIHGAAGAVGTTGNNINGKAGADGGSGGSAGSISIESGSLTLNGGLGGGNGGNGGAGGDGGVDTGYILPAYGGAGGAGGTGGSAGIISIEGGEVTINGTFGGGAGGLGGVGGIVGFSQCNIREEGPGAGGAGGVGGAGGTGVVIRVKGGIVVANGGVGGGNGSSGGAGGMGFYLRGLAGDGGAGGAGGVGGSIHVVDGSLEARGIIGGGNAGQGGAGSVGLLIYPNASDSGSGGAGGTGGTINIEGGTVTAYAGIGGTLGGVAGMIYTNMGGLVGKTGTVGTGALISIGKEAEVRASRNGPLPAIHAYGDKLTTESTARILMASFTQICSPNSLVEAYSGPADKLVGHFAPINHYSSIAFTVSQDAEELMHLKNNAIVQLHAAPDAGTDFNMHQAGLTVFGGVKNADAHQVTIDSLIGGGIIADETNAYPGQRVNLTITPDTDKQLKANTLKYAVGADDTPITGTSFIMPDTDVTLSAEFEDLPSLALAPIDDQIFNSLETGYSPGTQSSINIVLTNAGLDELTNLEVQISGSDFIMNGLSRVALAKAADTAFDIQAIDGLTSGTYTATVTVSADGMTPVTFTVTQHVSNPRLKSLNLGAGTLTQTFDGNVLDYTARVEAGISGITITPVVEEAGSTVRVNGSIVASGSASKSIDLAEGESNIITIEVETKVGATKTYTIRVNRGVLPLALLTQSLPTAVIGEAYSFSLNASGGTNAYTWKVEGLENSLSFDKDSGVMSGMPTQTGKFDVVITVTDNGTGERIESKVITLTIAQTLSIDLKSLTVSGGALSPIFDKNVVAYSYTGISAGDITIAAESENVESKIEIGDNGDLSLGMNTQDITLEQGAYLIPIVVTSPDPANLSQKAYVIAVNGTVSNAYLTALSVNGTDISGFDKATTDYTFDVGATVDAVYLKALTEDAKALMLIDGAIASSGNQIPIDNLKTGANTIEITVIAQNAETKTYKVNIIRKEALEVVTKALPLAVKGANYNAEITASGGQKPYTWNVTMPSGGLADGLTVDVVTDGITGSSAVKISGTPTSQGSGPVTVELTDANGIQVTKIFTLNINAGCGNGGYLITPKPDSAYTSGMSTNALPTMTINSGMGGFKYFSVKIEKVSGHLGNEVVIFVHMRGGKMMGINATEADFDTLDHAKAGFNVRPGDIIKVYIVKALNNSATTMPEIL